MLRVRLGDPLHDVKILSEQLGKIQRPLRRNVLRVRLGGRHMDFHHLLTMLARSDVEWSLKFMLDLQLVFSGQKWKLSQGDIFMTFYALRGSMVWELGR